jgi:hypothetical protein
MMARAASIRNDTILNNASLRCLRERNRLGLAGIDGDGVLTAILDSATCKGRDEVGITVAGLDDITGEQLTWTGSTFSRIAAMSAPE